LPHVNNTLTSLYDENKLRVSYLQPKFTEVSTESVIDSRKRNNKTTNVELVQVLVIVRVRYSGRERRPTVASWC